MSKQEVILCESLETSLSRAIEQCPHDKLFILTDDHTRHLCLPSLKETTYQADGLRAMLLQRNRVAVNEVNRLKQQKLDLKISEDDYRKQLSEIKSGKDTPTVIIKATDKSSYKNLIDALDEMQICNIGKYVITDIAEADEFLMKNYESKGELSQNIAE